MKVECSRGATISRSRRDYSRQEEQHPPLGRLRLLLLRQPRYLLRDVQKEPRLTLLQWGQVDRLKKKLFLISMTEMRERALSAWKSSYLIKGFVVCRAVTCTTQAVGRTSPLAGQDKAVQHARTAVVLAVLSQ